MKPRVSRAAIAQGVGSLMLISTTALAQSDTQDAQLKTQEQERYGSYITDREGHSLYMFANDAQGEQSTCLDACANAWPPYTTTSPPEAGEGIDESKLGTIEREDGTAQVTYDGWPLYYFTGDKQPGDALGQSVEHLGALWYLVSPQGEKITQGGRYDEPELDAPPGEGETPASEGQRIHEKIEDNPGQADDA